MVSIVSLVPGHLSYKCSCSLTITPRTSSPSYREVTLIVAVCIYLDINQGRLASNIRSRPNQPVRGGKSAAFLVRLQQRLLPFTPKPYVNIAMGSDELESTPLYTGSYIYVWPFSSKHSRVADTNFAREA
jgi:hypothetical protein